MESFQRRVNDKLFNLGRKRPWLSAMTGIPISTLNNWFTRARMPGADQMVKIAHALGTTVEYLITGEEGENLSLHAPNLDRLCDAANRLSAARIQDLTRMAEMWVGDEQSRERLA